jgi:hypothetical protein
VWFLGGVLRSVRLDGADSVCGGCAAVWTLRASAPACFRVVIRNIPAVQHDFGAEFDSHAPQKRSWSGPSALASLHFLSTPSAELGAVRECNVIYIHDTNFISIYDRFQPRAWP